MYVHIVHVYTLYYTCINYTCNYDCLYKNRPNATKQFYTNAYMYRYLQMLTIQLFCKVSL